jgi:hypothetical protein
MIELLAFAAQALTMASTAPLNWLQESGQQAGAAAVEVLIDPAGKALRCDTAATVGDAATVARICPLLKARRWRPANLTDGRPAYAVYRDVAKYRRGEAGGPDTVPSRSVDQVRLAYQMADFTLALGSPLPGKADKREAVATVLVNEAGMIAGCDASSGTGARKLREAACAALPGRKLKRQLDPAGAPVAYVTTVRVGFTAS